MTVEAIGAATVAAALLPAQAQPAAPGGGFGEWFAAELSTVNQQLLSSDHEAQQLAVGAPVNLHEVMIHMEEAKLSFQLLAAVRTHVLEAYQEVMRMQV